MSSWWSRLTGKDAYKDAQKAYEQQMQQSQQQYGQAQQNLQPFVAQGQQAFGGYSDAMKKLLDPAALQDEWLKSYAPSEQAKQTAQMAGQEGLDAASSMGMMGSTPAMQAVQAGTSQIMADDKQKYIDQLMQKYMGGAGIAGNIYGTGATAAGQQSQVGTQRAGATQQAGGDMAQLKYGQGASTSKAIGGIGSGIINAILAAYGIGKMPTGGQGTGGAR